MHKLITIRFSHYNEKARWALERLGVAYEEEGYMPGLHAIGVLKIAPRHGFGRADRIATPLATPVLLTDHGRCIRDSSRIVRYASDRFAPAGRDLYPSSEVTELEQEYSTKLGPHARRFAYFHAFAAPTALDEMAARNVGPTQAKWFVRLYPLLQRFIASRLQVTEERAMRSLETIRSLVADVSRRVEGRRHLVGDRFSAADLSFATMLAPAIGVSPEEGYGAFLPPLHLCPKGYQDVAAEIRATPAGQYALRMFREERKRPADT